MDIILKGEPKSTNNIYRYRNAGSFIQSYMSKEGKEIKASYIEQVKEQWGDKPMLTGPLEIWIELFFGTKRVHDWDNFHKLSMDALTGIVWEDDSQIEEAHVSKRYEKGNARIEITIRELSTGHTLA